MSFDALNGSWTYRSFRNIPEPVGDFNQIRFAETDMTLSVGADGSLRGTLVFPSGTADADKGHMDLEGRVIGQEPLRLQFRGKGRKGTRTWDYEYAYDGIVSPAMSGAVDQCLVLVGTVMRVRERTSGPEVANAGITATFAAVKRS